MRGPIRKALVKFYNELRAPKSFYNRFGGKSRFNIVLVVKALPFEEEDMFSNNGL